MDEAFGRFQKKVAEVQSQINLNAERGMVRDPQLEAAYRNLEDLRDKLHRVALMNDRSRLCESCHRRDECKGRLRPARKHFRAASTGWLHSVIHWPESWPNFLRSVRFGATRIRRPEEFEGVEWTGSKILRARLRGTLQNAE